VHVNELSGSAAFLLAFGGVVGLVAWGNANLFFAILGLLLARLLFQGSHGSSTRLTGWVGILPRKSLPPEPLCRQDERVTRRAWIELNRRPRIVHS